MKINVIGGGPAGMYFAILMKQARPAHTITIYERNGPDDTFGWGVVFSGKTLTNLKEADRPSHAEITRDFQAWDNVDVVHRDQKITIHGNSFSGIARLRLLKILQARCEQLGITINFHREVSDVASLKPQCDLLVGGDGVNSRVRQEFADRFNPDLSVRPNKYIWYGTHQLFHGLTLTFREHPAGVFAAHSYKFDGQTSTFIVECDPPTWERAGFQTMDDDATRTFLQDVFASDLGGYRLLSNNSKWINFVLVKNAHWSFDNVLLLGDALHTAHFSIGSGTKLAMEDAIALAECFSTAPDVSAALRDFEQRRKPVIEEYQAAAHDSMRWFENARDYMRLSPSELAYSLMTRSGRVSDEELRKRDPNFFALHERTNTPNCFRAGTLVKTEAGWAPIEDVRSGTLVWTHSGKLRRVIAGQRRPHVGKMIGIRLVGTTETVWATADQQFISPSPLAERGLGGEDVTDALNSSLRAGTGEIHKKLGGRSQNLWKMSRDLRSNSTPAEKILWSALRGQKMGIKFRRQHPLGPNYIVDFYAPDARLAIELDGSIHDSLRSVWSDGIRHRQIADAGVRVLRFRNDRIINDLTGVLQEIREFITRSPQAGRGDRSSSARGDRDPSPQIHLLKARELFVGEQIIWDESGKTTVVESVKYAWANERVYDLTVAEDHSFVTLAGIAYNGRHHS